jgi:Tfp pilus assembly protein PilV
MLKLTKRRPLNQRGDTIVEVLISIAIVSMILGGAYVMTNRSLQATRGAQERSNALKVVEAQLETLKSIAGGANTNLVMGPNPPASFCIVPTTLAVSSALEDENCRFDALGNAYTGNSQPVFKITITRTAVAGGEGYTFTIKNTWDSIISKNTEQTTMSYRIYKP